MRVVAGRLGGRPLKSPATDAIRPTTDRLRESLFNILAHRFDDCVRDARVLDCFAGTGALGIEAMSRGAKFCLFVEDGTQARALLRENMIALGLAGSTRIFRRDATSLGDIGALDPFHLMFCDPPYRKGLGEKAIISARDHGWLQPGALIVLEEASDAPFTLPERCTLEDERAQRETILRFIRFQ